MDLRKACLGVGLAATFATPEANAIVITGDVETDVTLSHAYYFALEFNSSFYTAEGYAVGSFDANVPGQQFHVDVPVLPQYDAFLALYDGGVVVSIDPGQAGTYLGVEFGDRFAFDESVVIDALNNDDLKFLNDFVAMHGNAFPGMGLHQSIAYSEGTAAGTVTTGVVPEPATLTAVGLGVAALMRRRRRT